MSTLKPIYSSYCTGLPSYITDVVNSYYASQDDSRRYAMAPHDIGHSHAGFAHDGLGVHVLQKCHDNSIGRTVFRFNNPSPEIAFSDNHRPINPSLSVKHCYEHMKNFDHFISTVFERKLDKMVSIVKIPRKNEVNWDRATKVASFSRVDTKVFNPFEQNADMVCHEFTHGVIQKYSHLEDRGHAVGQRGAIAESICDVYSIMAKQYKQQIDANSPDAPWDWGENLVKDSDGVTLYPLRSFKNPGKAHPEFYIDKDRTHRLVDRQVKTLDSFNPNERADSGGIHFYSGIPNHAFYIASVEMNGKCWEGVGQAWNLAMERSRKENFVTFAKKTIEAARDLSSDRGFNSHTIDALYKGWKAVGVDPNMRNYDPGTTYPTTDSGRTRRAIASMEQNESMEEDEFLTEPHQLPKKNTACDLSLGKVAGLTAFAVASLGLYQQYNNF